MRFLLTSLIAVLAFTGVAEARTTVTESSDRTLKLRVDLPSPRFVTREAGGDRYVEMAMEGMTTSGATGTPGLPAATTHFGIPQGADVSMRVSNVQSRELRDVLLYPVQPDAPDDGSPAPRFTMDERAYESAAPLPAEISSARALGGMRDLRIGGVTVHGGQYSPRERTLRVIESIDVTITFGGENRGVFGPSNAFGDWNLGFANNYESLVNIEAIRDHLLLDDRLELCGEELLIVTTKALKPAAVTLAQSRRDQGFPTAIKEVGSGSGQIGTTPEQIQSYIRGELNDPDCDVHPSYVILLGNTAHVPTFEVPYGGGGFDANGDGVATDHPYSLDGNGDDLFADTQVGRLPAADLAAATALVEKADRYASSAPAGLNSDFYRHATVTAFFQQNSEDVTDPKDSRTFTMAAERARTGMRAEGRDVDRLYFGLPQTNPLFFNDGTPMPAELHKPAFAWDANTADFLDAWNDGRFLIMHRGHGGSQGWASPNLQSADVPQMVNGTRLPVVFAINCASARFDDPANPSFVERQVVKPSGGAVAAFGDSRNSGSTSNTLLATGFFDAMFPATDPTYDGGPPTRRLGEILVRGKEYFAAMGSTEAAIHGHFHLYGLFGDPTLQMWAEPPRLFDPDRFRAVLDHGPIVRVSLDDPLSNGAVATLFDGDRPLGRAIVRDGEATIEPADSVDDADLTVSVRKDGALPIRERVEQ